MTPDGFPVTALAISGTGPFGGRSYIYAPKSINTL
jgi:hypothetical protein